MLTEIFGLSCYQMPHLMRFSRQSYGATGTSKAGLHHHMQHLSY